MGKNDRSYSLGLLIVGFWTGAGLVLGGISGVVAWKLIGDLFDLTRRLALMVLA